MRGSQLPAGAFAFVGSAIGALTSAGLDSARSQGDYTPSQALTRNKLHNNPQRNGAEIFHVGFLTRAIFSLPSQLFQWTCHADASGYDSMDPTPAPTAPASFMFPSPVSSASDSDVDKDNYDTITGVFHRLNPQRAKLLLVQVVFRHGARTPLSSRSELWRGQQWDVCGQAYQAAAVRLFSTAGVENPVSNQDLRQRAVVLEGGCRKGELTLLGQAQALELGRWLRSRYVEEAAFLPRAYQEGVVEARTTNISRTIASLRGVLTGLYPDLPKMQRGQGQQQYGEQQQGHLVSSVPRVTTSADLDEILYADTRACPHLGSFQAMSREAARAAVRSDPDYEWVREGLLRLLKLDPAAMDSDRWIFTDINDVLTSLSAHGKSLPPGFEDLPQLVAAINRLAAKEFSAEVAPNVRDSHGRTVLRLSMGRLLHILVSNMQRAATAATAAAEGGTEMARGSLTAPSGARLHPQMYLYSGHDSTIMPLLSALGLDVTEWPHYLSNLVLELWQVPSRSSGDEPCHVVRVLYNQQELPLPRCPPGFLPSLHTFQDAVVGPFLLSAQRHQELCRVKVEHDDAMPHSKTKAASSSVA